MYHLEKFALPISGWQTDCFSLPRDVLDKEESSSINGLMSAGKFHNMAKVNRPIEKEEGVGWMWGRGKGLSIHAHSLPILSLQ